MGEIINLFEFKNKKYPDNYPIKSFSEEMLDLSEVLDELQVLNFSQKNKQPLSILDRLRLNNPRNFTIFE